MSGRNERLVDSSQRPVVDGMAFPNSETKKQEVPTSPVTPLNRGTKTQYSSEEEDNSNSSPVSQAGTPPTGSPSTPVSRTVLQLPRQPSDIRPGHCVACSLPAAAPWRAAPPEPGSVPRYTSFVCPELRPSQRSQASSGERALSPVGEECSAEGPWTTSAHCDAAPSATSLPTKTSALTAALRCSEEAGSPKGGADKPSSLAKPQRFGRGGPNTALFGAAALSASAAPGMAPQFLRAQVNHLPSWLAARAQQQRTDLAAAEQLLTSGKQRTPTASDAKALPAGRAVALRSLADGIVHSPPINISGRVHGAHDALLHQRMHSTRASKRSGGLAPQQQRQQAEGYQQEQEDEAQETEHDATVHSQAQTVDSCANSAQPSLAVSRASSGLGPMASMSLDEPSTLAQQPSLMATTPPPPQTPKAAAVPQAQPLCPVLVPRRSADASGLDAGTSYAAYCLHVHQQRTALRALKGKLEESIEDLCMFGEVCGVESGRRLGRALRLEAVCRQRGAFEAAPAARTTKKHARGLWAGIKAWLHK